jgi:exopolysaccharide biosynthesis polyprenyl glycosylphosphotransferase
VSYVAHIAEARLPGNLGMDDDARARPIISEDLIGAADERTLDLLRRPAKARRNRLVPPALAAADVVGLSLAYLIATGNWGGDGALGSIRELILFGCSLPVWVFVAKLHGLYRGDEERTDHSTTDDVIGVLHLSTIGAWLLLVVSRIANLHGPGILNLTAFWLLAILLVPMTRILARRVCRRRDAYQQNTVIVGAGDIGQLIARKLTKHPEYGANIVGFVDASPKPRRQDLPEHLSILGGPDRLPQIISQLDVERVVIAFSDEPAGDLVTVLRRLRPLGVQIDLVPRLFDVIGPRVTVHAIEGLPLIGLPAGTRPRLSLAIKRVIDIVVSGLALIALAPLLAFIALRIRHDSPGPAFFRQTRLAQGMKEFTVLKFRTMKMDTDPAAHREYISRAMTIAAQANENGLFKLDRSDAVTAVGRWLRKTSLDELPQLINVLRGEMSLVGPRPCIPYEAQNFESHHLERFEMPQGLTGLWQVTARANSTYGEALDLDVAYVRDWSLGLDLRLLLRTPVEVIRQRSATA